MSSMHDGSYYYGEGAVNAYAARESGRLQSEDGMKVPDRVRQYAGNALVLRIIRFNTNYT